MTFADCEGCHLCTETEDSFFCEYYGCGIDRVHSCEMQDEQNEEN